MHTDKPITIFLVDDNNVFTLALKAEIETTYAKIPINVFSFETGEKCIEKIKEEKPQVVILDYHLNSKYPDAANGIKVLDWIKKRNYETNVIMLTNDDNVNIAVSSFKHGAADYVVKTETKFIKINCSLFNLFRLIDAKNDARRYKHIVVGIVLCIMFVVGGVTAIQIFLPSLLK